MGDCSNMYGRPPNQGGWSSGRLIFNTQFSYLWCARLDHDRKASGRLKLNPQFPYQMHTRPDDVRLAFERLNLNCDSCLRRRASGRESMSSGWLHQFSNKWTWKESEAWSNTKRRSDGLLRRPDGCKLEQKLLDTVEGSDGNPRRPD